MSAKLDQLDYYTLLGIAYDASDEDIRVAFRAFARRYHPDRYARDPEKRAQATEVYRRGSEGFQVLSDPDARELYDLAMRKGIRRLTAEQRDGAGRRKEARRKRESSKPRIQAVEAKAYYERAVDLVRQSQPREAWKALRIALSIEPGNEHLMKAIAEVDAIIRRSR